MIANCDLPSVGTSAETPPPKPPRGILRTTPPMKPARTALRVMPLNAADQETPKKNFPTTALYDNIKRDFKAGVASIRSNATFTGTEGADILEDYITTNRHLFKSDSIGRDNAVKVLSVWLNENLFRGCGHYSRHYQDDDKVFYVLCHESEYRLYVASSIPSPTPTLGSEASDASLNRSARRNNSLKRLFSPMIRRNRSASRGRGDTTLLRSTLNLLVGDKSEKKVAKELENRIKEEEAEIYEAALAGLLTLIDIPFLEDITFPLDKDPKKNASFLTSIMERMGLGGEERPGSRLEDEMDLLIETHPLIKPANKWFQMARLCAPMLHLEKTSGKSSNMQLYVWCKSALQAVSDRMEKLTQGGESPLLPVEFAPLLFAIANSLINRMSDRLPTAIQYLWLMVPTPLRSTMDLIIQWLDWTRRTNTVVDLRSPYYLGSRQESTSQENCMVIIDELRPFIFPRGCMKNAQQDIFINTLLELRDAGKLGAQPPEMVERMKRKANVDKENLARSSENGASSSFSHPKTDLDNELVNMMKAIIDDTKMSLNDKKKRLKDFSKHYPALYNNYFKDVRW